MLNTRSLNLLISAIALVLSTQFTTGATSAVAPSREAPAVNTQTRSNFFARTGGIIMSSAQGPSIKIVSVQNKIPLTALALTAGEMRNVLHLPIVVEEGKESKDAQACAASLLKGTNVAAVIVVHDSQTLPSLLIAPEERWALVNVAKLGEGVSRDILSMRLEKELWRAFGYVMGAANTSVENCVLKPVFKPSDLDSLKGTSLAPLTQATILGQAGMLGIQRPRPTTYRKACEEGWAPMPTNSVQKAIWEEVKAKK